MMGVTIDELLDYIYNVQGYLDEQMDGEAEDFADEARTILKAAGYVAWDDGR